MSEKALYDWDAHHQEWLRTHEFTDKTSRARRLFLRLVRRAEYNTSAEDTHCFIDCECGERLSASEGAITWCKCGRGYTTEFKVYRFERRGL